ncbi:MAG: glycosyltransferase family 4 protein [Bryobacteraceae bacterium]|nr:glycosyltransferase family 4 protein [Bryobacteraceae bacterium]
MKIAIVVHGRFHAFDLAAALLRRGNDVTVFTNYPASVARKFGLPAENVRSFVLEGVLTRVVERAFSFAPTISNSAFLHRLFGSWAARQLSTSSWDVIHCFSGIAEETLRMAVRDGVHHHLLRGSAHIATQDRLLREEQERVGRALGRPTSWMITRELREYELAERIIVLSTFARDSFLEEGVPEDKVRIVPLGVDTAHFQAPPEVFEARRLRVLRDEPLRIVYVGNASFQKGFYDFAAIVRRLKGKMEFRVVGRVLPEVRRLFRGLEEAVEFVGHRPHLELPKWYAQGDVFVFPTIQDGFAVVIPQAMASGLPVMCTANCSGPDLIRDGINGWVMPIRSPGEFIERLEWCDTHRAELAEILENVRQGSYHVDWDTVAGEFERESRW